MRKMCCLHKKLVRKRPLNHVYSIIKPVNKTVNKYNSSTIFSNIVAKHSVGMVLHISITKRF